MKETMRFIFLCPVRIGVGTHLKKKKKKKSTDSAHSQAVRDLDFNNNKPYHFVSGGDDAQIKFWDSRKLQLPITQIQVFSPLPPLFLSNHID